MKNRAPQAVAILAVISALAGGAAAAQEKLPDFSTGLRTFRAELPPAPRPARPKPAKPSSVDAEEELAQAEAFYGLLRAALAPKNGQGLQPLRPDLSGDDDPSHAFGRDEQVVVEVPAGRERVFEGIYRRMLRSGHASVMDGNTLERGPRGLKAVLNFHAPDQTAELESALGEFMFLRLKKVLAQAAEDDPANIKARAMVRWACESRVALAWHAMTTDLGAVFSEQQCAELQK